MEYKISDGVTGTKTIITDELLAKVEVQNFHKKNEENRARKNKYDKDCGLLLTSIEGQIEPTILSLIKGQPGYQTGHNDGNLIDCLKIIEAYCTGG